ncbi:MAG: MotA/TolQ/ExbB proton channel family protein [Desulfamplus sp.]|nr:MotA/TolQ/ExbB proton channel family protein [Desulfamplus sp.]
MDIATIIGIVSGLGFIAGTILLGSSLLLFWDTPSVVIVCGGTLAGLFVAFPLKDVLGLIKVTMRLFIFKLQKSEDIVANLIEISNKARKGGLLSIESDIANATDPYLASALQMTVDGVKTADIGAVMQKKMDMVKDSNGSGASMFTTLGSIAPAFGMIGTLIGLVQMLANLDDPASIGPSMAVAMITTFYGAILANLFFNPMANKLKIRCGEEISNMNIIYEGVLSIREGEHPKLLEEKLNVYLGSKPKDGGKK